MALVGWMSDRTHGCKEVRDLPRSPQISLHLPASPRISPLSWMQRGAHRRLD